MLSSKSSSSKSSSSRSSSSKRSICSRILTPKQVGPICWFMATFVTMFYSQRSRKILLYESDSWDKKDELFKLLKHILHEKFMKVRSRESEDYRDFSDDTFGKILSLLYEKDPKSFPYDSKRTDGFFGRLYIGRLYNLLNVDYKMFDYFHTRCENDKSYTLSYSFNNEDVNFYDYKIDKRGDFTRDFASKEAEFKTRTWKDNKIAPRILLISVLDYGQPKMFPASNQLYEVHTFFPSSIISQGGDKRDIGEGYIEGNADNLRSMNDTIYYNGYEYNLDSVMLANWDNHGGHEIAGITCEKDRYVYNGWVRTSNDTVMNEEVMMDIPCKLMEFNWNIKNNPDFCLSSKDCIPEIGISPSRSLCFNFSKGNRLFVYVREEIEDKIIKLLKNKREQKIKISKITDIDYIKKIINYLVSQNINAPALFWLLTKRQGELRKEKKEENIRKKNKEEEIQANEESESEYIKKWKENQRRNAEEHLRLREIEKSSKLQEALHPKNDLHQKWFNELKEQRRLQLQRGVELQTRDILQRQKREEALQKVLKRMVN